MLVATRWSLHAGKRQESPYLRRVTYTGCWVTPDN
jgi:hypothetical protein